MAGAATKAAFNASVVPKAGIASPSRTAMPVRTRPTTIDVSPSMAPLPCSARSIASVTISTSQGTPPISASFIAPTAPKRPSISAPVCAMKRACTSLTRPCTAPAHRTCNFAVIERFANATSLLGLRPRDLDDAGPLGDIALHEAGKVGNAHDHRRCALRLPGARRLRLADDARDLGVEPVDDRRRRRFRRQKAEPDRRFVLRNAGLGDGRHFGHDGRARQPGPAP